MRISMRWLFLNQDHAQTALASWISAFPVVSVAPTAECNGERPPHRLVLST